MVGRGALWTTDEIKLMAEYLGTDFGPNVPPLQRRLRDATQRTRYASPQGDDTCESWSSNICRKAFRAAIS